MGQAVARAVAPWQRLVDWARAQRLFPCRAGGISGASVDPTGDLVVITKAEQFRRNAADCRALTRNCTNLDYVRAVMRIADAWERLAIDREGFVLANPRAEGVTLAPGPHHSAVNQEA